MRHTKLLLSAFAYVFELMGPTLSNEVNGKALVVEDAKISVFQRVVALERFFGSSAGRLDAVFITKDYQGESRSLNDKRFACWSIRMLWFNVTVELGVFQSPCFVHHTVHCVKCCHKTERE